MIIAVSKLISAQVWFKEFHHKGEEAHLVGESSRQLEYQIYMIYDIVNIWQLNIKYDG